MFTLTLKDHEARANHALDIWMAACDALSNAEAALAAGHRLVTVTTVDAATVSEERARLTLKARIQTFNNAANN